MVGSHTPAQSHGGMKLLDARVTACSAQRHTENVEILDECWRQHCTRVWDSISAFQGRDHMSDLELRDKTGDVCGETIPISQTGNT